MRLHRPARRGIWYGLAGGLSVFVAGDVTYSVYVYVLHRDMARARRGGTPLHLALLDVDHFKRFNDSHGHQAGDLLLKSAAASWKTQLRDGDMLARYGSQEFAALLVGCSQVEAAPQPGGDRSPGRIGTS